MSLSAPTDPVACAEPDGVCGYSAVDVKPGARGPRVRTRLDDAIAEAVGGRPFPLRPASPVGERPDLDRGAKAVTAAACVRRARSHRVRAPLSTRSTISAISIALAGK